MNRGYMERVRTEYLRLWSEKISGGVRGAEGVDVEEARRWFIVDGMGAVDEVAERIWNVVEKRGQ